MILSIIVAMTPEGVIGKNNQLPWHLPDDLKRFKSLTMGHPIIMGRKTFESIGKPLPGRENIVVTHNKGYVVPEVSIVHNFQEALSKVQNESEVFVIGGASLFSEALPSAQKLYLTLVHENFPGDVFFPEYEIEKEFDIQEQFDSVGPAPQSIPFTFLTLERKPVLVK